MKTSLCIALVIVVAGCASTKRHSDDADIVPPAQTLAAQQAADLTSKVDALQTSLTELLERLDVMNDRIAKLESAPAPAVAPARAGEGAGAPPSPAPASLPAPHVMPPNPNSNPLAGVQLANTYRGALVLFGRGKFEDARRTFQQVFDQDPTGDLADNCLFWIGETYYATGKFSEAMKYYKRVTVEFAEQNKAPDAMFKIALAFEKTSDLGMAKQTLDEVIRRYPYSSAAASAKLELKRIRY
jgi:tol-pal system protein YbgF